MTERSRLLVPWLVLASGCVAAMWAAPGEETMPYHLAWIGLALGYGFDPWPVRRTLLCVAGFTVASGAILVMRASQGVIAWEETAEIPGMALIAALVVWHVRRRLAALATVTELAAREQDQARERERFSRLTSHEMRTPLTIATGYVDLLIARENTAQGLEDLEVVRDELDRLARSSERLLRMMRMQEVREHESVDMDKMLQQTAQRWATVAARRWTVNAAGGTVDCSAERMRACLDTLIENAVRYTEEGDTIRLSATRTGGFLRVGVADSGPGFAAETAASINHHDVDTRGANQAWHPRDPRSQTGLGIGLVREVAMAHGGKLMASRSNEGGADIAVYLPLSAQPAPDAPAGERVGEVRSALA